MKQLFSIRTGVILILTLVPMSLLQAQPSRGNAELTQSDVTGVTIVFSVPKWQVVRQPADGETLTRVDFSGAYFDEQEGQPQIPYHAAVIGIPVGAKPTARVLQMDENRLDGLKMTPIPRVTKVDGLQEQQIWFDQTIYRSDAAFPANLVTVDAPAFFRDQQVVRVRVAAAQYQPAQQRLRQFDRIVVRIDFQGGTVRTGEAPARLTQNEDTLLRNLLLNYDEAVHWRQGRKLDLGAKRFSGFQNRTLYKFKIREEGIYKIDGRFLQSNISNVDLAGIDPSRIQLFNNGGRELARNIVGPRPQGLVENAILVNDGGDGSFDSGDYLLFYARGVEGWEFKPEKGRYEHYINHYTLDNTYWLALDGQENGKRMTSIASTQAGGTVVETYQGLYFNEEEMVIPLGSGMNWFGQNFAVNQFDRTANLTIDLPNAIATANSRWRFRFAALNEGRHQFDINMNGNLVGSRAFSGRSDRGGAYIRMATDTSSFSTTNVLQPGGNSLQITYSHSSTFGQAYLDWAELFYPASMRAVENELVFNVMPASGFQTYRVSNFSESDIKLFDVTDNANVQQVTGGTLSAGSLTFTDFQQPTAPKRYVAVSPSSYREPSALERQEFTDLRNPALAAEYVIITHPDFLSEALRLESYRENGSPNNKISTQVVLISDIYDNFSAGMKDAVAIRDFTKFAYDNWTPRPLYVLLLGDGDYDHKNIIDPTDIDWVPTFQSDVLADEGRTTIAELETRTSDSWYTYMDSADYPTPARPSPTPVMDLAIGRLNVQTIQEAKSVVDKIVSYESQPVRDIWRNTVTVVGDDELVTGGRASAIDDVHIFQAESVAENSVPQNFDVQKIYLTEFPKVVSAATGGVAKPLAKEALIRQMNLGTLIVNYIGHGNSTQWAHELIFQESDDDRVQNQGKLMFFIAATCDWALYDRPSDISQAEELLLAEDRGAIGILSSARLVFSTTNFNFTQSYYQHLFNESGRTSRIGDAFVCARIDNRSRINDEKYHIYGDPVLRLAMPERQAIITSMTPDSILALTTVEIEGEVRDSGQLATGFNGTAFLTTFDSRKFVRHVPEAGRVQPYFLPGNSIFRGTVPVADGKFHARFIVPKDISYGGRQARVSAYFWNDETDGIGFRNDIKVSSETGSLFDSEGPQMRLFFRENDSFRSGDVIDDDVTLVVELADTVSGINIAGEIGHQLTLSLDPDEDTCLSELNRSQGISSIDLTSLFRFNQGDHLRGTVEMPLHFPEQVEIAGRVIRCAAFGEQQRHNLVVKAWDNSNNSSTVSAEVLVVHEDGLVLREVMNYPNPFKDATTFTFFSNLDAEVKIKIYTVAGQLIRTLEYPFAQNGFNMVDWNGRDAQGDIPANGVYLYKLIAKAPGADGPIQKEVIGRLAIVR